MNSSARLPISRLVATYRDCQCQRILRQCQVRQQTRYYSSSKSQASKHLGPQQSKKKPSPDLRRQPKSHGAAAPTPTPPPSSFTRTSKEPSSESMALKRAEAREEALRNARIRRQTEEEETPRQKSEREEKEATVEKEKRYKQASKNWTRRIVALPILIVTSYYLWDRCKFLGRPSSC